jgi:replicative DNA helicase
MVRGMSTQVDPDYATLGGLLLAPDFYEQVVAWLHPEDFARPVCGEVFELIGDMRARNLPVDAVTVLGALRERGRVRPDGYPANELIAMVEAVPVPASTPYYGQLVLAAAVFRRIDEAGTRLRQIGRHARGTPDDAFELLAQSWQQVAAVRQRWQQASRRTSDTVTPHDRVLVQRELDPRSADRPEVAGRGREVS